MAIPDSLRAALLAQLWPNLDSSTFHCTGVRAQNNQQAMQRIIFLFTLLFLAFPVVATEAPVDRPLDIIVNFAPPFPREFTAYFNNPTAYSITVTNYSDQDQEVYFLAEMRGLTNNVLVQTRPEYRSNVSIVIPAQGTVMLTGEDVANLNEGIQLNDLNISGLPGGPSINSILPEGIYQFCINAYDFVLDDVQPLSVGCGTLIDITYADQLTILAPNEGEVLLANPSSAFEMMWDPNETDPMRRMDIEYEVKMIDITTYPDEDLDILLRDGGPQVEFEEDMITNEFYLYNSFGTNFELEFGHQYAMRVRRLDPEPVPLINDGYSEIRTFWYGEIPEPDPDEVEDTPQNVSDCVANCEYTNDFSDTRKANTAGVTSLEVGHFTMEDVVFQGETTGPTWRGTGTINLGGWMMGYPLAVTFNNIVINENNRVIGGVITARDDSNQEYDLGDIHDRLDGFSNYIPDTLGKIVNDHVLSLRMLDVLLGDEPQGFPVGIQEELKGHKFTLALVGATFTARGADIDIMTLLDLSSLNPQMVLPLAGRDICLTPQGFGSEAMLYLSQDVPVPPLGGMNLALVGSSQSQIQRVKNRACYIEFDCDGLKELAVRGRVAFPRSMIVPDNNGVAVDTGKVKGLFEFTLDRNIPDSLSAYAYRAPDTGQEAPPGTHLMMGFTMTPFQIAGLDGWTFTVREATLDLSDLENPSNIRFPKNYEYTENVDTGLLWQGFHLKKLAVATPRSMRADSQRSSLTIQNVLLDFEPSLTMNVRATNLIDKSIGAMDGWGFSLDTFQLTILQNTLYDGKLMGKLSTPLVGSADYLNYKAVVNQNEEERYEFNAIATPAKDSLIRLPMVLAKAGLCPNSFIQFQTSKDTTYLQAFLAGQMSVDVTNNMPDSVQALNLLPELSIKFAEFQLNFDNKNGFVTAGEAPIGTESMFGFAVDFQDELCGTNYNGPVFYDTDRPDYDYDVSDIDSLLNPQPVTAEAEDEEADEDAPQEKMSGFPISIGNVSFNMEGVQVGVELDVNLHLAGSENHEIKASTRIGMASTLKRDKFKIKKFHIDSVYLSSITLGTEDDPIDLDFMSMYGGLEFVNFSGGKGFRGDIHLQTSGGMGFDLIGGFGKAGNSELGDYGTAQYHGWWYLDGMFKFPGTGIPLAPMATMHGIGGGVYWNCTAPGLTLSVAEVMAAADGATQLPQPEYPEPSFAERTIAFRTNLSLVRPSVMVAEPEVVANWTANQGLNSLSLNGNFWALAQNLSGNTDSDWYKESAKLWGETNNTLRIERSSGARKFAVMGTNRIFANLINDVLYGAGDDRLMVQSAFYVGHKDLVAEYEIGNISGNTFWFLNIGNPYAGNMGGLEFRLPGFNLDNAGEEQDQLGDNPTTAEVGAGVDFYLMAGMNIPNSLPEPPGRITELFGLINRTNDGGAEQSRREDERSGNDATLTGTGIVVGAHAYASAEVNAVLYARLAILAGLDFMAFQYPDGTGCITEGGQEIPEIGVNGWYGTGRAYVGIEGIIGARGRFMGNEIDVRILHLAAAAMVEAGGPRPMYLKGRLGIYYSLLGGLIEGSARMQINVGDRCQPIGGSPFGFPIIVDSNPNDANADDVSALVRPKVSFSVPLAANKHAPTQAEIMNVPDTEGNIHRRFAYIHSFTITQRGTRPTADFSRDTNYPILIEDGRAAEYRPVSYLSAPYDVNENRRWRMRIVVRAKERLSNGSWIDMPGVGNSVFEEVREVDFTTGPLPETMLDEQVGMTKPFRFQHFYLQEDAGHRRAVVYTRQQEEDTYFATTSPNGFINYEFTGRVFNAETGEQVASNPVTYYPGSRRAMFNLPMLPNDQEYELAIVRRGTNQMVGFGGVRQNRTIKKVGTEEAYAREEINSEYEVSAEVVNLGVLSDLGPTETLIYKWNFRTSEHNNLEDKLEGMELYTAAQRNGYQRIRIAGDFEGFDHYDIYGKTFEFGTNQEDEEQFQSEPLVTIADPFTSTFHTELSRPLIGGFATEYQDNYSGEPTGLYSSGSVTIEMPTAGPGTLPGGNPLNPEGVNMPSNPGGGTTTTTQGIEIDLIWSGYPGVADEENYISNPLNYLWTSSGLSSQEGPLNEHIESNYLKENTAAGLANQGGSNWIYFSYYVTEKVLSDAEDLTDFYEFWRDRILRPEDHVDNFLSTMEPVVARQPDRRRENLEDLEARYLALVNSDLVRQPPATVLTLADYDEEEEEPAATTSSGSGSSEWGDLLTEGTRNTVLFDSSPWWSGLAITTTQSSNNNLFEELTFSEETTTIFGGDDPGYRTAVETIRSRFNSRRYGFSNELRFRAYFPDTGMNGQFSSRTVPLDN